MAAPTKVSGDETFDRDETPIQIERFISWKLFDNALDNTTVYRSARGLSREMVKTQEWEGPCYTGNAIGFAIRALRGSDPNAANIDYESMFIYERWSDNSNSSTWCITPKPEYRLGTHYYEPLPRGRLKI